MSLQSASVAKANRILHQQGLAYRAIEETGGRGNCFFLAILDQLKNQDIRNSISQQGKEINHDHQTLRETLVIFMMTEGDFYNDEDVVVWLDEEERLETEERGQQRSRDEIWEEYLQKMFQVGEFANEVVIKAAAHFFGIDILVINETSNYPMFGTSDREELREPHMALENVVALESCI